ncbi:MAG: thioredoxin family protein [Crocinitomicaceae bacterium]|nr:thioredoxin family protein [Crocinitomicaceae bacterium]
MKHNFMKSFILFLSLIVTSLTFAQPGVDWTDKLSWEFSLEKKDASHAFLVATAKIKKGWHIYSVNHDPNKADFTGYPTTLVFPTSKNYRVIGKLQDGKKPVVHKDDLGVSLFFENSAVFKQEIEFLTNQPTEIKFGYTFQLCDESGCIFPPEQEASVKAIGFLPVVNAKAILANKDSLVQKVDEVKEVDESIEKNENTDKVVSKTIKRKVVSKTKDSMWVIFFKGFGGGLIALLTPCVFPMIPMTVTFFTKQSKKRITGILNALLYGVSIIVIYVTLGLLITALLGPSGLNDLSTNVWMNLIFFAIFIFFAISFLGAFELRMPSSWVNKADGNADKGGLIGIFFMAFTLSLVSFSCTGPIIGTLLVESATGGDMIAPAIGMGGFAVALALPFTLFAIFPGWLNSLPQSGGWLNSVKVVLGLLELALALKFLSGIDLAYHWDILTRELFVAVWIVIFFIIGFYLLGKLKFSHDSPVERLTVTRFVFALSAFIFAVYLIPGMWGAPLRLIDGVAPPRTHSEDNFRFVKGEPASASIVNTSPNFAKYRPFMHEVGDGSILVFHDLEKAKEYAALEKKPILLDFTGYNCPNCRRTESTVWSNEAVNPILKDQVVIASLYVDDREKLPKSEWKYSKAIQGMIKTVGNKWSDYQVNHYGQLSQPLYVMIDAEGNDLNDPIGYVPDVTQYKAFLMSGLQGLQTMK